MMTVNETITRVNMLEKIAPLPSMGYRFVTMTAVDTGDHFDIYYHFDLEFKLVTYRLELGKEETLLSISKIWFAALIVENEIQDLFGITVTGMEIDYQKRFLLAADAPEKPFCRGPGVGVSIIEPAKAGGAQ